MTEPSVESGKRGNPQKGFSTIEVIAALLLFSIALLPIVQIQLDAQRNAQLTLEVESTLKLERQALSYLQSINFASRPTGRYAFGSGQITWRANYISDNAQIVSGGLLIALYRVEVEISGTAIPTKVQYLHAIGWTRL